MIPSLQPGRITGRTTAGVPRMEYFVYLPKSYRGDGRAVYSIHGISRNAEEHVQGFIAQAERHGTILIAPLFSKDLFPRYQQLGTSSQLERADMAFEHIVQDSREWLDLPAAPLRLFGFSGGGQFVHRYALFFPQRVARMALAAPGWYTFLDPDQKYPYGLKSTRDWPNLSFPLATFLQIPTLVFTGELDDLRDRDLNTHREIDAFQGLDRIERAERWTSACRAMARAYGLTPDVRLEKVPNASHAYESYLGHPPFAEQIFDFLFES